MNTTQKSELIDEMLEELNKARMTKQAQMGFIADICEKTNNILLQIEASQKGKTSQIDSSAASYKYRKETLHALAKMIELIGRLVNKKTLTKQPSGDFETYTTSTKVKIDFLGSGVRKLLALNDTINQIGSEMHHDNDDFDLGSSDANSSE